MVAYMYVDFTFKLGSHHENGDAQRIDAPGDIHLDVLKV
jgi:hypothetical protein